MDSFSSFSDEVDRLAGRYGSRTAVRSLTRSLSFAELADRSHRLAAALGVLTSSSARVAILDKNSCEVLELFFACAHSGRVLVTLNWRLTAAELAEVVRHSNPEVVVVGSEFTDLATEAIRRAGIAPTVFPLAAGPAGYEALVDSTAAVAHQSTPCIDTVITQQYTSGTSGKPKGVLGTHRSVGAGLRSGDYCRYDENSVLLCAMPMFHIGGLQPALIALVRGGEVLIRRDIDPVDILRTIEERRVTHGFLVPTVLQMLVDAADTARFDVSSIRGITYGASPITPSLLRRAVKLFGRNLIQVYGSTETCGAICQLDPDDHHDHGPRQNLLRSAGKPYPWVEVRISDLTDGRPLAAGEYGEVWIRCDQNSPGYANDPIETARTFDGDGWLHTGDGGYLDEAGYLFLTDRVKDMLVSGGENVYPAEVEAVIAEFPGIESVAVIGTPDPIWGERVVAAIVPVPGTSITPSDVIDFCKQNLAGYKCPKQIWMIPSLPVTPSGKVLKRALRERVTSQSWPA